jgi:predicted RNA-binding protein with PIN domain
VTSASDAVPLLPEAARRQVIDLAAQVLGDLADAEVPAGLRKVRDFAPARRARSGGGPLAAAVERDAAFRHRVAAAWRAQHPELAQMLDDGQIPAAADPQTLLGGLYLLRPAHWQAHAAAVRVSTTQTLAENDRERADATLRAQVDAAAALNARLQEELSAQRAAVAALQEELAGVRRELRRHRSDADRARAQARQAQQDADTERERIAGLEAEAARLTLAAQQQLTHAREREDDARRAAREGRSLADARVRLLLDTVVEAATGLRRELALPPTEVRPADLVQDGGAPGGHADRRSAPDDDAAVLTELLALPQSHLIVDGYNVTKTGYGTLPLVEQRRRLVDALAALAARTASEVTCCFDGAQVEGSGATRVRGVRVLFSRPGVTADELVRRLVRAEPAGRPVVVVSSDAEVVRGVRGAGARAVPSSALLKLLGRG